MAAQDPNIKEIKLTGDVDMLMGTEKNQTRSRRRGGAKGKTQKLLRADTITKEGGGSTSPGTLVQLASSHVPGTDPKAPPPVGDTGALTQKGAPIGAAHSAPAKPPFSGGAAAPAAPPAVKVVLEAPKKKRAAVVLAPAAHGKGNAAAAAVVAAAAGGGKRRTRKIKVSMRGLTRKIHRAHTIRKAATDTTLEQIKKELQKAGLIKAQTKAPEPILRQMYADFMTLKTKAL